MPEEAAKLFKVRAEGAIARHPYLRETPVEREGRMVRVDLPPKNLFPKAGFVRRAMERRGTKPPASFEAHR